MLAKPPPPIRHPHHLRLVASLPCLISGNPYNVQAHHLLRTGEHCMGRKSGDDWAVPLRQDLHRELHEGPLDEPEYFKEWGLAHDDVKAIAQGLYRLTLEGVRGARWTAAAERLLR